MRITWQEGNFISALYADSICTDTIFTDRNAVDFGLPLINNPRCAQLFVEALAKKMPLGGLEPYRQGKRMPTEVKPWSEWVHGKP